MSKVQNAGSAAAAELARAEARRRAEEAARQAAEAARKAAAEAARKQAEAQQEKAASALKAATDAQTHANQKSSVATQAERAAQSLFKEEGARAGEAVAGELKKEKLTAGVEKGLEKLSVKDAAAKAAKEAQDAQRDADELLRKANNEIEHAVRTQKNANAEARKINEPEPFPEAEKIRDIYEGGKAGLEAVGKKLLGEKVTTFASTRDPRLEGDSAEAVGRREGRAMADRAVKAAEEKLGKPLDQASPIEADKALQKALEKEEKALPEDALEGIEDGKAKEQAREFAEGYGSEARKALKERLGEANAKVALNNDAGRALREVSAKNVEKAVKNEFGEAAADVAKAAAKKKAWSEPTPAESAHVIREAAKAGPREGAAALRDQLRGLSEKERGEVIRQSRDAIKEIGSQAAKITDDDEMQAVVDTLSRASEIAGTKHARDIAEPFIEGVPRFESDGGETGALNFAQALRDSIEDGKGSLFATEVANEARDMPQHMGTVGLAETVQLEVGKGMKTVREDFEKKAAEVDRLNQELGVRLQEWKDTLTPEQLEKAAKEFQNHPDYKKAVAELEESSGKLANTLPGAARALEIREKVPEGLKSDEGDGDLDEMSFVGANANEIFNQIPRLGQTEAGQRKIADGLEAQGRGEQSFFTSLEKGSIQADDPKKLQAGFQDAIVRSAATRAAEHTRGKDPGKLEELFNGLNANAETAGFKKDSLKDLVDLAKKYKNDKEFDGQKFSAELATTLKSVAGKAHTEKLPPGADPMQTRAGKGLAVLGLVVGGAALGEKVTSDKAERQLRALADGLGIAGDVGKLLPDGKLGSLFTGAGALAKPVGLIFDGVAIAQSLKNKDYLQAGFSAATLGANLIAASAGGPLAVGATAAVSIVGQLTINQVRAAQEEKNAEQRTEAFLRGAGITDPDALLRLRDLNGDHQSIGHILRQTAAVSGGYSPAQLLQQLSKLDSDTLEDVVKKAEDLERNEDGTYKSGSVAEFHQYLIDQGHISPSATNGRPPKVPDNVA
jgi:hypothetical protein